MLFLEKLQNSGLNFHYSFSFSMVLREKTRIKKLVKKEEKRKYKKCPKINKNLDILLNFDQTYLSKAGINFLNRSDSRWTLKGKTTVHSWKDYRFLKNLYPPILARRFALSSFLSNINLYLFIPILRARVKWVSSYSLFFADLGWS